MDFLYPNMLYGLFALAIPIIVHLFNFRRHKLVYFSNTALLKNIQKQTAKTNKIKHLLVLITRLLFIFAIVVAFAHPYFPEKNTLNSGSENLVTVYVDNSMSMQAQAFSGNSIDEARKFALDFVKKIEPANKFVLLTNNFELRHEYPMNQQEMIHQLEQVKADGVSVPLKDVIQRATAISEKYNQQNHYLVLLSDFQKSMMNLDGVNPDSSVNVILSSFVSPFISNIFIDSCWLSSPVLQAGMTNELFVKVRNESQEEVKGLSVSLEIDGKAIAFSNVDVAAENYVELQMQFVLPSAGCYRGKVSIIDQPIVFDDDYYFTLNIKPSLKILEIKELEENSPIELLFGGDELFEYKSVSPYQIDFQEIYDYQLIIVNVETTLSDVLQQNLLNYAEEGGTICIFQSKNQNSVMNRSLKIQIENLVDTTSTRVHSIAEKHPFFENFFVKIPDNADFPVVKKHHRIIRQQGSQSTELIALLNGNPLLMMTDFGKGKVFNFSTSLDLKWSDLTENSLFVPLMYKMAFLEGGTNKITYTIGEDRSMTLPTLKPEAEEIVMIKDENANFEMIPEMQIRNNRVWIHLYDKLPFAGFYNLFLGDSLVQTMAWNDNRIESEMKFVEKEDVSKLLKSKGFNVMAVIDSQDLNSQDNIDTLLDGSWLWKAIILFALLALLAEVLILRFWK